MSWSLIVTANLAVCFAILWGTTLYLLLKEKKSKKTPQKSIDCQRMLHDMMNGGAVLHIEVIDPSSIYVHRS